MKTPVALLLLLAVACSASAVDTFPGLKSILTPAEWSRAGLDRLTPDQIGVIDAALIRHALSCAAQHQADLDQARASAPATNNSPNAEQKRRLLERFGLPFFDEVDWRSLPPLKAKVLAWETPRRFRLDNGQVWEGLDNIPYELVGKEIEIQARPHNQFALVLDGKSTSLRVIRSR